MKDIKITVVKYHCKFCEKEMKCSGIAHMANPFCNDKQCYEERLEASGAIDLRDNHTIVDHENGYISLVPIDSNKKWKALKRKS